MKKLIKNLIFNSLKKTGYELVRVGIQNQYSMEGGLFRCTHRGLRINTVVDIGASDGSWSRLCRKYLPAARYLLIEAQEPHKPALETFCEEYENAEYIIAAAGRKSGKIYFNNSDLFGGLASETPFEKNTIEVPVTTIDSEVESRHLEPPFLIKLDTHGYEIPILEGASETIKQSNLLIIETYNYRLTNDSLRYYEIAKYLADKGFSTIELVDLMLRKKDQSLWQMDTFYIPSKSKEFDYNSYD